jgi:hypothetical protein
MNLEKVTYRIIKFLNNRPGEHCPALIEECLDGFPVNIYTGYDRGDGLWILFPNRKLMPSVVDLKKKTIGYSDANRAY